MTPLDWIKMKMGYLMRSKIYFRTLARLKIMKNWKNVILDPSNLPTKFDLFWGISRAESVKMSSRKRGLQWYKGKSVKMGFFLAVSWIFFDWCVVRSQFFYWRKDQVQTDFLNTLNMVTKSIENFLEAFKKSSIFTNITIRRNFNSLLRDLGR